MSSQLELALQFMITANNQFHLMVQVATYIVVRLKSRNFCMKIDEICTKKLCLQAEEKIYGPCRTCCVAAAPLGHQ
jgi:hypothetical protein